MAQRFNLSLIEIFEAVTIPTRAQAASCFGAAFGASRFWRASRRARVARDRCEQCAAGPAAGALHQPPDRRWPLANDCWPSSWRSNRSVSSDCGELLATSGAPRAASGASGGSPNAGHVGWPERIILGLASQTGLFCCCPDSNKSTLFQPRSSTMFTSEG